MTGTCSWGTLREAPWAADWVPLGCEAEAVAL